MAAKLARSPRTKRSTTAASTRSRAGPAGMRLKAGGKRKTAARSRTK